MSTKNIWVVLLLAASFGCDAPTGGGGECVSDGMGGLVCEGGGCDYTCCRDGMLATCALSEGSECGVAAPVDCGGGRCAPPGGTCDPSGTGSCVSDGVGGLECRGGDCPYECCTAGRIQTCFITEGFECAVAAPVRCGGELCAPPGGSCDAGVPDGGVADAGAPDAGPPPAARLLVAIDQEVCVFDDAGAIAADGDLSASSADAVVPYAQDVTLLDGAGDRIVVGLADGALQVYETDTYGPTASPSETLPTIDRAAEVQLRADVAFVRAFAGIRRVDRAGDGTWAEGPLFQHPFFQIESMAYDPSADRLFAGQISGAGVLVFEGVTASTATAPVEPDFVLYDGCAAWAMAIAGGRLFAACNVGGGVTELQVWDDVSGIDAARPPDLALPLAEASFDLAVGGGQVFVLENLDRVVGWPAGVASAGATPSSVTGLGAGLRAMSLAVDGTLAVRGGLPARVILIRDLFGAPAIAATLTASGGTLTAALLAP